MAKSTNELIASFVFLIFRIWITVTSDEKKKTKALLDMLVGSGIVIHQMKALGVLVD